MTKTAARKTGPVPHKTELGFKVEMLKSHREAEAIAALKEQAEDLTNRIADRLEKLLPMMREDGVPSITARTAAGTPYRFEAVDLGEKVKMSKVAPKPQREKAA
jgi:hypothetical protein